ncbi:MAG: sigma-70 family RNA polymerase sigma factor [Gemmatimonadales bacterium]|nr:sigma-70 family RNA polymerase sigma factor [Gemmatimonadales bacterium]
MTTPLDKFAADLALVDRILAGSEQDWHHFIDNYSGLVYSVLRRYLFNEEDVRDVWVLVMERLIGGTLKGYAGRSSLSTWLVFVARSTVFDHLRSARGRREDPPGLENLSERCRLVFDRFYRNGCTYEEVRHELVRSDLLADGESLAAILVEIEEALNSRVLRRIVWDLQAASVGVASGRMLEFLEVAARESRERSGSITPEMVLFQKETTRTIERIRELMQDLPEQERRVLELRFDDGWSANRIADELELSGQREVYTIVNRATRALRRMLGPAGGIPGLMFFLVILLMMPSNLPGNQKDDVQESIRMALSPQEHEV